MWGLREYFVNKHLFFPAEIRNNQNFVWEMCGDIYRHYSACGLLIPMNYFLRGAVLRLDESKRQECKRRSE